MVLIAIAYVVVQEMVARLAVHTGKGLAALIREEFSLRLTAFAVAAFAIANVGLVVTEFAGIATAFSLFGVSRYLSRPDRRRRDLGARALRLLPLRRADLPAADAGLRHLPDRRCPRPSGLDQGGRARPLWPHFIASQVFLLLGVALIGTTITPYIQLYEAGAVVDKGIGPEEYKYERVDAIGGAVAGDRSSRSRSSWPPPPCSGGTGPLNSAAEAAHALRARGRLGGRVAVRPRPARRLGPGRRGRPALDVLRRGRGASASSGRCRASFRQAPLFLGLFTAQIVIGAAVVLVPGNLIHLIVNTQVLEGVITPITLVFILVLANRRSLLGTAANGPVARWLGGVCVVAVGGGGRRSSSLLTVLGWFGVPEPPLTRAASCLRRTVRVGGGCRVMTAVVGAPRG